MAKLTLKELKERVTLLANALGIEVELAKTATALKQTITVLEGRLSPEELAALDAPISTEEPVEEPEVKVEVKVESEPEAEIEAEVEEPVLTQEELERTPRQAEVADILAYQKRVQGERNELHGRITKLATFMDTDTFENMPNLRNQKSLLVEQHKAMCALRRILDSRIASF